MSHHSTVRISARTWATSGWRATCKCRQTLYDREGSQYRNADGSVWARFKAGKAESEAVSGNIDMDSNYSQFQLGGDILAWGNGQQSITVGVIASYINADTDSTGNRGADGSQFTSSANVDGYNLGVYATGLPMPKRIAARMSTAGTNMVSTTTA
ncbi:autotransporter outer membrane beta-barrel domain-containing protein [Salmonella enterica subsp. enterica]|nr:autotransporter outer membrane beta-barrel domain-containing protein [Salmonella enterica subsp. enterica]